MNPEIKPAIYHGISRVVDRRFVFGDEEREAFRMFMRMQEKLTGCQVVSYRWMSNHLHVLLEVPPMAAGGLSDEELLKRLPVLYSDAFVAGVAAELNAVRSEESGDFVDPAGREAAVEPIYERFTSRMHDLSQFMKGLLIRFTR
jgi:putative transposase